MTVIGLAEVSLFIIGVVWITIMDYYSREYLGIELSMLMGLFIIFSILLPIDFVANRRWSE